MQMKRQLALDQMEVALPESIILAFFNGTARAIQTEDRLAPSTDHMHVSRTVIVRINDTQSIESVDRWHNAILSHFLSA
jgi:hypothetical protein